MEQGRIVEAEAPTVQVGATPTGLTVPPPPQPLQGFLQAGCHSCHPTNSVKALKAQVLMLNSSKTEFLLTGLKQQLAKLDAIPLLTTWLNTYLS